MKLAVVILNWRNSAATIHCASLLLKGFTDGSNIYIVDNNSDDGSVEAFRRSLPECCILENTENSGYTGGNNLGLRSAFSDGYDAVLILNNDIEPRLDEGFVSRVARIVAANPNTLIGVPVHDVDGRPVYPHIPTVFFRVLFRACGIDVATPLICGCAMVVTRGTFRSIGVLDDRYFMYCEELDYSVRLTAAGGRVVCPAELGYVVRDDKEERRPYVYYYQARNLLRLINQHARSNKLFLAFGSVLVSLRQAIYSGRVASVYLTCVGVSDACRGRTGRNPVAHI